MPSIEDNLRLWDGTYEWPNAGDEWSSAWGGTDRMWRATIYPRIKHMLPVKTILEIAPGFGRCTEYLKGYCERLIVVDLSPRCIEACKNRFARDSHIEYHVNDGKSLDMIPDRSIDFVFSFDSLVHAQADVMETYVRQLGSKLKATGSGFIHHSNLGCYRGIGLLSRYAKKIGPLHRRLLRAGLIVDPVWRGDDMTAEMFNYFCERNNLRCVCQELINWANHRYLIDAFSIFTANTKLEVTRIVNRNPGFMEEVRQSWLRAGEMSNMQSAGSGFPCAGSAAESKVSL
jgi:hypothetical protein